MEVAGRDVTAELPGRQGRLLFAYLVAHRGRPAPREVLVDALWGEAPPGGAGPALSALLSRLRGALGEEALAGRSAVRLRLPADAWIDLEIAGESAHRAESAIAQRDWARAWGLSLSALFIGRRGFLPGEDLPWVVERRRTLEDLYVRALECYAACALGLGGPELPVGEGAARELVAAAPYRESGYRLLMEILAARGNVAEALRVYEDLRERLREELGAVPCPEVREVQARLLRATA